jgi:hypothetical protein
MLKRLLRKILPNPFTRLLIKAHKKGQRRFLIIWNRGMGDIALGLYGLNKRIREIIPTAEITYLTRPDLEEAFHLLSGVNVIVDPKMVRQKPYTIDRHLDRLQYDVIIEKPDPTYWLSDQIGKITPKLVLNNHLDQPVYDKKRCVGMHVFTETGDYYGYEKNWPVESWKKLIEELTKQGYEVLLFGLKPDDNFAMPKVTDLRGKTSVLEMISIIKNRCSHLIAPDSGVLSLIYYIDEAFPLKIISLWADPMQGILKAGVPSPNPMLVHKPLISSSLRDLKVADALEKIMT